MFTLSHIYSKKGSFASKDTEYMRRLQKQTTFYTGANLQVFVINIVRIVDNYFLHVASTIGKIISDKPLGQIYTTLKRSVF